MALIASSFDHAQTSCFIGAAHTLAPSGRRLPYSFPSRSLTMNTLAGNEGLAEGP
jgi:hypothetical protein